MIPYGKHYLDEEDIQAVVDVLRNGWLTQGPKIKELEDEVAAYVGSKYAIAVSSGTAALHLACLALNITTNSKVVTSTNTFVASANCIKYVDATPVFCDINPKTLNIDVNCYKELLESNADIDALIPVHFGGLPCDMDTIYKLSHKKRVKIIEDASHAFGATYKSGGRVGNCKYSDITTFSLHPVKGITSGEGGLITTNSDEIYNRLQLLRSHGICKGNFDLPGISEPGDDLIYKNEAIDDGLLNPWYYEMQTLGYNYRITDIQCALVLSQLKKIDKFIKRRRDIVKLYDEKLKGIENLSRTQVNWRDQSANHIYVVRINFSKIGKKRGQVMRSLLEKGVGTQVHYIPVTKQPYYNNLGYKSENYPNSEEYYDEALTIPVYYSLSDERVDYVVQCLKEVLF